MIIGISGKRQTGKSLVGKIINFLTSEYYTPRDYDINYTLEDSFKDFEDYTIIDYDFEWQIKQFSDNLKDIVCIILGCTRKQLEDEEFRNTPLGEEWARYTVIDKYKNDTVVDHFESKEVAQNVYNIDSEQFYLFREFLTPGLLLQSTEIDLFRGKIHPNTWINSLMQEYKVYIENYPNLTLSEGKPLVTRKEYSMGKAIEPNWIITDVYFPNEVKAIEDRKGFIIRLKRTITIKFNENLSYAVFPLIDRESYSEAALNNHKFKYLVENNGTIEELIKKIAKILIKEKILKNED